MNIYVDFDDCLCETARHFSTLAEEMFGLNIPYEKIKYFNQHGLTRVPLFCLNKYGRDNFIKGSGKDKNENS